MHALNLPCRREQTATPSCASIPTVLASLQCSTILPSARRSILMLVTITGVPRGLIANHAPWWVPRPVTCVTTRSPSAICASIVSWKSGKVLRTPRRCCLYPSIPGGCVESARPNGHRLDSHARPNDGGCLLQSFGRHRHRDLTHAGWPHDRKRASVVGGSPRGMEGLLGARLAGDESGEHART